MRWEALEQWGRDVAPIEPLAGGVANQVWSVRVNGQLAVGRLGSRSDADLAWETDLLRHLDHAGLTVPVPIATTAGRLFADGLVVMTYVAGDPPESAADWRRVANTLRELHRLTQGWRSARAGDHRPICSMQRPGQKLTSAQCRLRRLLDAEQRGRASADGKPASFTATPTPATSA